MSEQPWVDWSVKDHVDEAQRLSKQGGTREWISRALALAQIHATLALAKAQMGQTERGY